MWDDLMYIYKETEEEMGWSMYLWQQTSFLLLAGDEGELGHIAREPAENRHEQ